MNCRCTGGRGVSVWLIVEGWLASFGFFLFLFAHYICFFCLDWLLHSPFFLATAGWCSVVRLRWIEGGIPNEIVRTGSKREDRRRCKQGATFLIFLRSSLLESLTKFDWLACYLYYYMARDTNVKQTGKEAENSSRCFITDQVLTA